LMRKPAVVVIRIPVAFALLFALAAQPVAGWAVTLQEEIDLGKRLNDEILKQTPLSTDRAAQKEIDELGQRLVRAGIRRPEIEYHFQILQDDDFNAFAIPGGYVYFTQRLWNVMRKDERVGVLAHEIAHTDRRHAIDAMLKAQRRQIFLAILLTAVKANNTWANIADLAHSLYTLKYSRGDERQADEVGVELCQKAGFNPAGLLLAMRKINRFQSEQGGEPPKIFSSHPPTPERLQYLQQLLTKMNVPIPPEDVKDMPSPNRIGEVVRAAGGTVEFTSSKHLGDGDVVWIMRPGWDFYYENRTDRPAARAIVRGTGPNYSADVWPIREAKADEIAKGAAVCAPPAPVPETGIGRFQWRSRKPGDPAEIILSKDLKPFDRLLARQTVWNKDFTRLVYDNTGYVALTDAPAQKRYVALGRPEYSYAPVQADSILVKLNDPDQKRWVGPVISIGRSGQTIEIATTRTREQLARDQSLGKRFDVVLPPWDSKVGYADRVVGKASVRSLDKKTVLQMISFSPGWSIESIENGFDVYEEPK
jgi:Zn-dependent protease with chaperone function